MTPEEWYSLLLPLLLRYAERKFGVPAEDAEDIAHDVFLSFLAKRKPVRDPRAYLIGAMSYGCRSYWRKQARQAGDARPEERVEPAYVEIITTHQLLRALPARERRVLLLRAAGYTVKEIAVRIAFSVGGTEKVLRRAMARAAELAEADEETERWRVGERPRRADTNPSVPRPRAACRRCARRIIRPHVCRLRGAAVPRTPPRAAVFPSVGRAARQVPGQLSGAPRHLQTPRGFA
ncbi:MAG TPA: sigma-70 family RNA polymerase sigma factor [Thermoanaerobaculia bacterium]|jgi:RNA polymerase sigma factor (sigma-70 family)